MRKLVIFDLDGTLLNTIDDITNSLNNSIRKAGLKEITVENAKYFVGSGVKILIERLCKFEFNNYYSDSFTMEEFINKYYEDLYNNYMDNYSKNNAIYTKPYDGVVDLIKRLKKAGINVAVLSNKPHNDTVSVINHYFGLELFDSVMGKKEENRIKPHPDGAFQIMRELGFKEPKDVIYVGDTNIDIETAKNIKCQSIAVTWGFRKLSEIYKANNVCDNVNELYDLIRYGTIPLKNSGVFILNKETGKSSNAVINDIKYRLIDKGIYVKRIGHAGTLDPLATGVMVVLVNDATKLSDFLMCEDKDYVCEICFGESFDTLDIIGKSLDKRVMNEDDLQIIKDNIDIVLENMKGENEQVPPMYSSIKVNGLKLYQYVQFGLDVERKSRKIMINEIKRVSDIELIDGKIYFKYFASVSKGTYIRSICESIGEVFKLPCAMSGLNRTRSGNFRIEDSLTHQEIINSDITKTMISMTDAVKNAGYDIYDADEEEANDIHNGMELKLKDDLSDVVGIEYEGQLIGLYERKYKNIYKVKRVWK